MTKSKKSEYDRVYAQSLEMIVDFSFDAKVAGVFSDMVKRSVPAYQTFVSLIGLLAEQYVQSNTYCYDLGCSLGATTLAIQSRLDENTQIIAVDNSPDMLKRCRDNLRVLNSGAKVQLMCADIQTINIHNASVVVFNLTLQFIQPKKRLAILKKVYQGLKPGGIVVICEKVVFDSPDEQQFQEAMHIAFKKANAYSELEISQKRQALENVLTPESLGVHKERLRKVGFERVYTWAQCFNFAALVAHKPT